MIKWKLAIIIPYHSMQKKYGRTFFSTFVRKNWMWAEIFDMIFHLILNSIKHYSGGHDDNDTQIWALEY